MVPGRWLTSPADEIYESHHEEDGAPASSPRSISIAALSPACRRRYRFRITYTEHIVCRHCSHS